LLNVGAAALDMGAITHAPSPAQATAGGATTGAVIGDPDPGSLLQLHPNTEREVGRERR